MLSWRRAQRWMRGGGSALLLVLLLATGRQSCWAQGSVWAWGDNTYGELGNNTTAEQDGPVQAVAANGSSPLTNVLALSGSAYHTLALVPGGTVWAWGDNNYGELGQGMVSTNPQTVPIQVLGPGGSGNLSGITAISAGTLYSLALKNDGTVWGWGYNSDNQLGLGNTSLWETSPTQVVGPGGTGTLTGITAIAAGYNHALALKSDGTVWAWGDNSRGELGNNNTDNSPFPVQVLSPDGRSTLTGIAAIGAGEFFSVALTTSGTVYAWGDDAYGELGSGYQYLDTQITFFSPLPVQVLGPNDTVELKFVTAISVGDLHTLALMNDGTVYAWGDNSFGEIGDGSANDRFVPVQVLGTATNGVLTGIAAISAGSEFSMALGTDGTVWTWGDNEFGELGFGASDDNLHSTPTQLTNPLQVTGIYAAKGGLDLRDEVLQAASSNVITGYQLLWQNKQTNDTFQWVLSGPTRVTVA